jgi:hypothetical protein
MRTRRFGSRARSRRRDRPAGVSRVRAAAIARGRVARELIGCEVYDRFPAGYAAYWRRPPPRHCWYVVCGPKPTRVTGGSRIVVCISRRTGRVLRVMDVRGE